MEKQIYIHYGDNRFDPAKFESIKNDEDLWIKPKGGLWASRIDASFGWKDWCDAEDFRICNIDNAFKFILSDDTRLAILSSISDIRRLPMNTSSDIPRSMFGGVDQLYIDFEKCLERGIDAIELCWYGTEYFDQSRDYLHYTLYGWDCDSIIILNPNIVQPI